MRKVGRMFIESILEAEVCELAGVRSSRQQDRRAYCGASSKARVSSTGCACPLRGRLRWVDSALLYAETRWNRLHGYRHLPLLLHNLQRAHQMRCHLNPPVTTAAHAVA